MNEEHRVLWYASDGLNGKIGCLGKPPGRIALNGFQESFNARLQLPRVLAGVVGGDMHKRNAGLLGSFLHGEGLHFVECAELQGHVDDAVGMQVVRHLDDVLHALVVGRKDGAVDLKVALGDGIEHLVDSLTGLVDQVLVVARARAGLLAHHDAAGLLDEVE